MTGNNQENGTVIKCTIHGNVQAFSETGVEICEKCWRYIIEKYKPESQGGRKSLFEPFPRIEEFNYEGET